MCGQEQRVGGVLVKACQLVVGVKIREAQNLPDCQACNKQNYYIPAVL